jgi:hypothetical protein
MVITSIREHVSIHVALGGGSEDEVDAETKIMALCDTLQPCLEVLPSASDAEIRNKSTTSVLLPSLVPIVSPLPSPVRGMTTEKEYESIQEQPNGAMT